MTTIAPRRQDLDTLVNRVAAVAAAQADATDREARFPTEALEEMRQTRLLGLTVPREHDGLGGSLADLIDVTERLARSDMSVAMIFAMHCQQVAALVGYAGQPLRDELLPRVAAGEVYLASVTTALGTGGSLLNSAEELAMRDEYLLLDRFAPIVTGGGYADGFLVTMRSPDAMTDTQVSLLYADRGQLTIEATGNWQPLGMRATHSGALRLRGTLPAYQVVGEHGRFHEIVSATFGPLAHLGWSAAWLGTANGVLSRVVSLLRDRRTRGSLKLDSELLLTRLADARQRLTAVYALLGHTAQVVQRGENLTHPRVQMLINGLKVTASEQCYAAVDDLVEAVGLRHGYLRDSVTRLERALRDLRSASLNYSNDRLRIPSGKLVLLDPEVRFD
uniref:Acyl-CoA dehydrogenase domain protein n=1 Tax=Salinispora arenicola (strain CNS-205) TaxID=391037 RepID=A8M852_SALAI